MRRRLASLVGPVALAGMLTAVAGMAAGATANSCNYWAAPAPAGSDRNPGTFAQPWASLDHASAQVLAEGRANCTVWFKDGQFEGANDLHERFATSTTFRAVNPYRAILENDGQVVELSGARNLILEGFEIRHSSDSASKLMIYVSQADGLWSEHVTLRNNIIHDSYNNDLLKIHNGARFIAVEGNIFYNQGPAEEHIDVNGVEDVAIQDNIFFNDFAGSGRSDGDAHSFITIKDSTGNPASPGSRRIAVRRNIFLNWEGRRDTFIQVGNDGKPYHEAIEIRIENNLLVGNAPSPVYAAIGVRGARAVTFVNNTVLGNLPASAYAFWIDTKDLNPPNEQIGFHNNIWSDPTGTMGAEYEGDTNKFSNGDPANTAELLLDRNLYWNGGAVIPPGDLVSPLEHDGRRLIADPLLPAAQDDIVLPRWAGAAFLSGSRTVREEFVRLVERYGSLTAQSPALDAADPAFAPVDDILGRPRGARPELGAYEVGPPIPPTPTPIRPPSTPTPTSTTPTPSDAPFRQFLPVLSARRGAGGACRPPERSPGRAPQNLCSV